MTLDLALLRRLLAAATPGPWTVAKSDANSYLTRHYYVAAPLPEIRGVPVSLWDAGGLAAQPDAELIAAAVNALPELLDEVERLRSVYFVEWCHFGPYRQDVLTQNQALSEVTSERDALRAEVESWRDQVGVAKRQRNEALAARERAIRCLEDQTARADVAAFERDALRAEVGRLRRALQAMKDAYGDIQGIADVALARTGGEP